MSSTIDAGGRVVIPRVIREQLGIAAGSEVEISLRGSEVVIVPVVPAQRLVKKGKSFYAEVAGDVPPLDAETVRDTLESVRR